MEPRRHSLLLKSLYKNFPDAIQKLKFQNPKMEISIPQGSSIEQILSIVKVKDPSAKFGDHVLSSQNLHLEEFCFKYFGPWLHNTFDIVVSFYNEEKNVEDVHWEHKKLERLIHVNKFIYVNNGSSDQTLKSLQEIARADSKIQIVNNTSDMGYGNGYKSGIKIATADFILTNHSDGQFKPYEFIYYYQNSIRSNVNIIPHRVGRPLSNQLYTKFLKILLSLITQKEMIDFNGQPKILLRSSVPQNIVDFPNNFTFDLALYLHLSKEKIHIYDILETSRKHGVSRWNTGLKSKIKMLCLYINFALRWRKL